MRVLTLYMLFILPLTTFAQQEPDSNYIKPYTLGLIVSPQVAAQSLNVEFLPREDSLKDISYEPNNLGKIGVKIGYNGLSIALMTRTSQYGQDPERYGKTAFFSLSGDLALRTWVFEADYARVQSLYLENPGQFATPQIPDLEPRVRPDIIIRQLSLSGMHIFNAERYSYKSTSNQSEVQLKSAGSFLLKPSFSYVKTTADTSLVPRPYQRILRGINNFRQSTLYNLILQPGYGHNFVVFRRITISMRVLLGIGYQFRRFGSRLDGERRNSNIGSRADFGIGIHYVEETFFMGISIDTYGLSSPVKDVTYQTSFSQLRLYLGWRFPKVKILQERNFLHRIKPVKKWIDGEL